MELIESQAGINYFRIVWTEEYKKSQDQFYRCVQTGDPNTLVQVQGHLPIPIVVLILTPSSASSRLPLSS